MPYIIAEIGVNHGGDIDRAADLIESAISAGADCVKLQLFTGLLDSEPELEKFHLDAWDIAALRDMGGIDFLVTPFSIPDADALFEMGERRMKLSHRFQPELWAHLASMPVMLIASAVDTTHASILKQACQPEVILYCSPEYPSVDVELNNIRLFTPFAPVVGYSDHTRSIKAALRAAECGARVIEVHFTGDHEGYEAAWSKTTQELAQLVRAVR